MTTSSDQNYRSTQDSPGVVLMPPAVFLTCLAIGLFLEWLLPFVPRSFTIAGLAIGTGLFAAGFAFMMWGHGRFKTLGVNVKTILPASQLVTGGAYRFSRNPMYVGFVTMLAGLGIALSGVWLCAICLPFFSYFNWYVIPREEAYLARSFGPDYVGYCGKTRRWL